MSINRVVLVGNLARDIELRYTPAGVAVANTAIAVQRITKNESGDYDVDFFNITAFQRTADFMSKYLSKGSKVGVEGRLQSRSWVDQASGQKRTVYEVIVDNVQSLSSRQDGEGSSSAGGGSDRGDMGMGAAPAPSAPSRQASGGKAMVPAPDDIEDEADPFADE
jgi:single-strand DNA-binding protein